MSIDAGRPDVARVMGGLKDFQRASAEYVFGRLYLDEKPVRRFLIADEVGLGKTLVAKGVIAKAIAHLWESVERIDVLYICSNAEIARQNIRKLNPTDRTDFALASRITLLPITVENLKQNKVNFISFTPGTSLDLKSSLGMRDERLLLLALLERGWGVEGAGVENLLAGHVQIDRFRRKRREFEDEYGPKIDATLSKQFFDLLARRAREDAAVGREDMRSRLNRLAPAYTRGKRCVDESVWWEGIRWVGDLRATLAEACLDALQPDLVVLDEFQRFKGLLDGTDPASELASKIFSYRDVRVLLLSATPYKMYTTSSEADGEDHYRDFLETLGFLFDDSERRRRVEVMVDEYRRALLAVADAGTERLQRARDALEGELRSVMVRTERLAISGDRNGMLRQPRPIGVTLEAADVRSYLTLQRVARILDQPDVIEFWKSAPYALNFMDDYQIKERFEKRAESGESAGSLARVLAADAASLLPPDEIARYGRIDPANARLRALTADTLGCGAWRTLWLRPSFPYLQAGKPFDAPEMKDMTKRLVFSSWKVVPKVVAALLSYEAERQMVRASEPDPVNTPEKRRTRGARLRFSKAKTEGTERLVGMPVLSLVYPSRVMARLGDPLAFRLASEAPPASADVLTAIEARLAPLLVALSVGPAGDSRPDESWYWAAPILLDLHDPESGADAQRWWSRSDLAQRWRGDGDEADGGQTDEAAAAERSGWDDHVVQAGRLLAGSLALGRQPDDLAKVLARTALGAPGTLALRALLRLTGADTPDEDAAAAWVARRDSAARIAFGLVSLFNQPDVTSLIQGLDGREPYWQRVVEYSIAGDLQSVLDEYAHMLGENLGVGGRPTAEAAPLLAEAIVAAVGLRTSIVNVDILRPDVANGRTDTARAKLRTRFASRLAEEEAETGSEPTRQDQVRAAFNSPFWPFVLATTSVGQEGLDFHPYCHAVVHWNLPSNPVDLEQREGRVHRFKGHAVRRNVAEAYSDAIRGTAVGDPWTALFTAAVRARSSTTTEMEPYWILHGRHQIERHVPHLPLSRDVRQLEALRKSLAVYRMVFGQPRQEELAAYLATRLGPELLDRVRGAGQIRLAPPAGERTPEVMDQVCNPK